MNKKRGARAIFADNLNKWLNIKGKTQSDLVRDLGITASTVSDWATGKKFPRIDTLQIIADYLGVLKSALTEHSDSEEQELWELRQQMADRPEMKVLFSLSKKAKKEDILIVNNLLEQLRKKEMGD
jgi:transcriptional regulator with XRE-family HTH domain